MLFFFDLFTINVVLCFVMLSIFTLFRNVFVVNLLLFFILFKKIVIFYCFVC
jgi:hypothetical protein